MSTLTTYDKAVRLIRYATGEEYGDYDVVHDIIDGYVESRYGARDDVVVLGNWNDKRWVREESDPPLTPAESMPSRLARSLERIGAKVEWHDEWSQCQGCFKAVRTEPNSYHWQPMYHFTEDGFYCHECLAEMGEDALEEFVNDSNKCVTWCEPEHVESLGYEKWKRSNPKTYASGWFEGQDDKPAEILATILSAYPDAKVVFFLDEASQFYIKFSAYFSVDEDADEDEDVDA